RDFVVGLGQLLDADIDLDVDRRLRLARRQGAWCVRILEREILDVLAEDAELRLALLGVRDLRRAAIAGGRHRNYLSPLATAAVGGVANTGPSAGQGCHAGGPPSGGPGGYGTAPDS